ncbi:MAG: OmpA family protein [bacterium]|nr:OmpA family protein [bacterium]
MRPNFSASLAVLLLLASSSLILSSCGGAPPAEPWKDAFGTQVEFGFEDQDPDAGQISGDVVLSGVKSPTGFTAYQVYWAKSMGEADKGELLGEVPFAQFRSNPLLKIPQNSPKKDDFLLLYITDGTAKNTVYTGKSTRVRDLVSGVKNSNQPLAEDQVMGLGALEVDSVHFDFDQSAVSAADRSMLDQAFAGRDLAGIKLLVVGHCDQRGSNAYNLALGQRRAQSVKDYLVRVVGLPRSQVTAMSCGEEQPLALGEDEADYSQNRRAVTLSDDGQPYDCAAVPNR